MKDKRLNKITELMLLMGSEYNVKFKEGKTEEAGWEVYFDNIVFFIPMEEELNVMLFTQEEWSKNENPTNK